MPGGLPHELHEVILSGPSTHAKKLKTEVERAARTPHPVLVYGEPGTGKDAVANLIHDARARGGAFVAFYIHDNLEEDLEKLLARHRSRSAAAAGNRNTLFFEDIADFSSSAQRVLAAFLKSLVGTGEARPKVIVSTTQDLQALVKYGAFSKDLFWQLNVQPLALPNLQHRKADIPVMVRKLVKLGTGHGKPAIFSERAMKSLVRYSWPGNLSELRNVIVRLRALGPKSRYTNTDVKGALSNPLGTETGLARGQNLSSAIYRNLEKYFKAHEGSLPPDGLYERIVKEVERPLISLTLEATGGNQLKAAKLLGLNRNTLRKKLKNLDIRAKDLKT
jgi:two-component system nitrogen regulation response regulator GlnG